MIPEHGDVHEVADPFAGVFIFSTYKYILKLTTYNKISYVLLMPELPWVLPEHGDEEEAADPFAGVLIFSALSVYT